MRIRELGLERLLSPIALLLAYALLFDLLDRFDWGEAFVRFACLAALMAMVVVTPPRLLVAAEGTAKQQRLGLILAAVLALVLLERGLYSVVEDLTKPPVVDIGITTQDGVRMLLLRGENPYQSRTIAVLGDDSNYWGFKYGPTMLLGYAACALSEDHGIKLMNGLYLALCGILVYTLGRGPGRSTADHATGLFCAALLVLPHRIWYETFHQGAIDIFPVVLILASLRAGAAGAWFVAGLLAGLSFSAKFSPAIFYLLLLVGWPLNRRLVAGILVGLLPFLPFALWDGQALLRNYLLFHLKKPPDSTSLYSITPRALHVVFPILQVVAAAVVIVGNRRAGDCAPFRTFWLLVLILAAEITYKEVHGNHLIWIVPFAAIHLGRGHREFLPSTWNALFRPVRQDPDQGRDLVFGRRLVRLVQDRRDGQAVGRPKPDNFGLDEIFRVDLLAQ
jgi:hypothetical protein